jgi:hypothetical protein
VDPEETLEEEELGEENQVDVINVMSKAIWIDIFPIRGSHGALTTEPMAMQLNNAHN